MKKSLVFLPALIFLIVACGDGLPRVSDKGDNHSLFSAQELNMPVELSGSLSAEEDFYKLNLQNKDQAVALFIDSEGPLEADLYDLDRTKQFRLKSGQYSTFAVKGIAYIRVFSKQAQAEPMPYTIRVKAALPVHEQEPNANFIQAQKLAKSLVIEGSFHVQEEPFFIDNDFYKLQIQQTGRFLVQLELAVSEGVDPIIHVYNQLGQKLFVRNEAGEGEGEYIRDLLLMGPGELYFEIANEESPESSVYYELFADWEAFENGQEYEPNDNFASAVPFSLEGEEFQGKLHDKNDIDYIEINGLEADEAQKSLLQIVLHAEEARPLQLSLLDSFGQLLSFTSSDAQSLNLPNLSVYGESYFVELRYSEQVNDSNAAAMPPLNYELRFIEKKAMDGLEIEPNDRGSLSESVEMGQIVNALLSGSDDKDFFEFNIFSPGEYKIEYTPAKGTRVRLSLYDQNDGLLREIALNDKNAQNVSLGELNRGTYRLSFTLDKNSSVNVSDFYRFRINP